MKNTIRFVDQLVLALVSVLISVTLTYAGSGQVVAQSNLTTQTYQRATKPVPNMRPPIKKVPQERLKVLSINSGLTITPARLPGGIIVRDGIFYNAQQKPMSDLIMRPFFTLIQQNFTKVTVTFGGLTYNGDMRNTPNGSSFSRPFPQLVNVISGAEAQRLCDSAGVRFTTYRPSWSWRLQISDTAGQPYLDRGVFSKPITFDCR